MTIPVPRCGWASLCSSELPKVYMKTNGYISFINSPTKPIAMNKIITTFLLLSALVGCQTEDTRNTYSITGRIIWEDNIPYTDEVTVTLLKGDEIIGTSHESPFTFNNLEEGVSYIVEPKSTAEGRNGISTLDLVSVEKNISGEYSFDLFQSISADVNKDSKINSQDLDIMKNCILSSPKIYECPGYRFVSQEHDATSFQYVDRYYSGKLNADQEVTFIPIKLGDVNGTIHP